jgi:hypothetical protein
MKRSQINELLSTAETFFEDHHFHLPPFARWTPARWEEMGSQAARITERRLGWDVTDFGSGQFFEKGLLLFTLRNGSQKELQAGKGKVYAEKVMMVRRGQSTPLHFHRHKTEDIINRGGGTLILQLYQSTESEDLSSENVVVWKDGLRCTVPPGKYVSLHPGESITLSPFCYHTFWGEEGNVLVGEVSSVNDDQRDNRFYKPSDRYMDVKEDEEPLYLLVSDYERWVNVEGECS